MQSIFVTLSQLIMHVCYNYSPNGFSNILQLTMMLVHRNMSYKLKNVVIFLKIYQVFL